MSESTMREIRQKIENFCAYQERCHQEIEGKLRAFGLDEREKSEIIAHLIEQNFLNEERFSRAFARGKHRIKHWGKSRIVNELKMRNISQYNINAALQEIDDDDYLESFDTIALRQWNSISEPNPIKKRKKFCDFLLRKGYETDLVYEKMRKLEQDSRQE